MMYYFGVYLKKPFLYYKIFILIFLMLTSNSIFVFTLTVEGKTFAHGPRIDPPASLFKKISQVFSCSYKNGNVFDGFNHLLDLQL
jgi:hypothetical protein